MNTNKINDMGMSEEEIKNKLNEEEYKVLRMASTEKPFTGALLNEHRDVSFHCKVCDEKLFESDSKFDSGTG
jgi:peptide-methionine (R)-S-oxide reductase